MTYELYSSSKGRPDPLVSFDADSDATAEKLVTRNQEKDHEYEDEGLCLLNVSNGQVRLVRFAVPYPVEGK